MREGLRGRAARSDCPGASHYDAEEWWSFDEAEEWSQDHHSAASSKDHDASECSFEIESQSAAASVTVDPHRKIVIESRCANNTIWRTVPPKPTLLLERLIYALQLVLGGTFL